MKKLLLTVLMICAVALTACSSAVTGTPIESTGNSLPMETLIAIGTLKLAGTDQDVTAEQAQDLVVLWQVYEELGHSDTAAQEEVDAVTVQIQETMTAAQLQAITDMQITQQDVFTAMQGATVSSSSSSSDTINVSSSGGMPGGAPPDGGISPDMSGGAPISITDQSAQGNSKSITQVPSALVQAVIQSLEQKIAA